MGQMVQSQRAAVVMRLAVQANVPAGVEVDLHAPLLHGPKHLRSPRRSGLAVATGSHAKDTLDIVVPGPFAAVEFRYALVPAEVREVHSRRRLHAVEVGM